MLFLLMVGLTILACGLIAPLRRICMWALTLIFIGWLWLGEDSPPFRGIDGQTFGLYLTGGLWVTLLILGIIGNTVSARREQERQEQIIANGYARAMAHRDQMYR